MLIRKLKKGKKRSLFTYVSMAVIFAMIIACIISVIVTHSSISDMQSELRSIDAKKQELEAENVELQRILEDDDMNAYMEKIAIEDMDYAYPNERRYYDTSRN